MTAAEGETKGEQDGLIAELVGALKLARECWASMRPRGVSIHDFNEWESVQHIDAAIAHAEGKEG
jgi:hypothetical protein